MHEGRKDVVSGKHMVIFEKVQCDENKEQRGKEWERGFCWCRQKPVGQTPQLVLHPKHPGRSSSLTPQLLQDLTFLGYIQGVFSAQPHYVTLSTALEAVGPGERGKRQRRVCSRPLGSLWSHRHGCGYRGWWSQERAQVGKTTGEGGGGGLWHKSTLTHPFAHMLCLDYVSIIRTNKDRVAV